MTKPAIICVDDEPTALESLKIELKRVLGDECLIETAEGGEEALELLAELQRDGYEVALVLADHIMPGIKGDELLKQIHSLSPQTLKIMVTGQADLEAVGNAIRYARLYRYIAKPWEPDDLRATVVEAVRSYIHERKLEAQNTRLQQINQELEQAIGELKQAEAALRQEAEQEQAFNRVIQTIHNSLDLTTIFSTAASEISSLLQVKHLTIIQFQGERGVWRIIGEQRQSSDLASMLEREFPDQGNEITAQLKQLEIVRIKDPNFYQTNSHLNHSVGDWLMLPLQVGVAIWGCIGLGKEIHPDSWQNSEVELARAVAKQLAIAIQQAELHEQLQRLNADLEQQVQARTGELQLAYEFESTLKRITDKVRDSLDENQILQSAVEALVQVLGVGCCNAALFDSQQGTSTICYEYTTTVPPSQGRVSRMADFPEIYNQLLQGQHFQFCSLLIHPRRGRVAMLVCPILDDKGVLGDLWLINQSDYSFNEQDIRLVQQLANQCAIALRQAQLYQAAQAQVKELERLNRLQDEFLSTVSHELRSPMSNIKMAIKMLEINLKRLKVLDAESHPIDRYFQILKDECQRETNLINDLLDLSLLDGGTDILEYTTVKDLSAWILHIAEPFIERAQNQQQSLQFNLPAELPVLCTDFSYLERILIELLNNACKYTPTGETIRVSAGITADLLNLSVANSGIEIRESEQTRIFDKFYRIPHHDPWKFGGTGLGLALVKKRVEQLQGTIEVTSEPGWTIFTVKIPAVTPSGREKGKGEGEKD